MVPIIQVSNCREARIPNLPAIIAVSSESWKFYISIARMCPMLGGPMRSGGTCSIVCILYI